MNFLSSSAPSRATLVQESIKSNAGQIKTAMLVVHVQVQVKPECIESFREASLENARNSVREPGIARFDVVQSQDDPARFVLVEAYRTPEAPAAHKATAHYAKWRDAVAPMMAEPRSSVKYVGVFPPDEAW
jgi:(4S)-4-hydroxy-5-phosphonooxypentane-2,3-dione isomerase